MPGKVADASVLGAMMFGEPRGAEAASLLSGSELYEPMLLAFELASITRKKILSNPGQRDSLLEVLDLVLSMDIRWIEVEQHEIVNLALNTGLTTYDASYLSLSRRLGIPLVTFDAQLEAAI